MNGIYIFDVLGISVPAEKRYEMIKEAGFDGIQLWRSADFSNA